MISHMPQPDLNRPFHILWILFRNDQLDRWPSPTSLCKAISSLRTITTTVSPALSPCPQYLVDHGFASPGNSSLCCPRIRRLSPAAGTIAKQRSFGKVAELISCSYLGPFVSIGDRSIRHGSRLPCGQTDNINLNPFGRRWSTRYWRSAVGRRFGWSARGRVC